MTSCFPQSVCWLSSTTCTRYAFLTAWPMCTLCCTESTPGFRSVTGKPKSGTGQARNPGWRALTAAARLVDPEAVVWRGDPSSPPSTQGVKVLGTPLGHPDFVRAHLRSSTEARVLMQRIPSIPDLQGAWLLLLFCAGSRAHNLLRVVPPDLAFDFAAEHDLAFRECLSEILGCEVPDTSWEVANVLFSIGGSGLWSAPRLSTAACWASWADCLHTVQLRHPQVGEMITTALTDNARGHHLQAAVMCRERLLDVGFEAPSWVDLQRGAQPRQNELDDAEPGIKKHGWQFGATQKVEDCLEWDHACRHPPERCCAPKVVQWVETDFGQTDFGHPYPTDFGQTDFAQTDFGQSFSCM